MPPFDPFQSRRNYDEPCRWWSRDERSANTSDELIMKRDPSGFFMAKEENSETSQNAVYGGSFMVSRSGVMIKSPDNLWGIKPNDLVEYRGEKWIVVNVQKRKARVQNAQYADDSMCSHFWYIELRK